MRIAVLDRDGRRSWYALEGTQARRFNRSPFEGGVAEDTLLAWTEGELRAPVRPSKIVCVGRNYAAHAKELGNEVPKEPLLFLKAPSAIIGPGGGVVIGRRIKRVSRDAVREAIYGYTCVCDVTARDLQKKDGQWSRAKGFDSF